MKILLITSYDKLIRVNKQNLSYGGNNKNMESKNRYLIAIAAVLIHVSIGSVYAWSVFTNPVMKYMNVSLNETQWVFSLAIFFLGMSAAFLGKYVEKYGPRKSGIVSSLFFTIGLFGSGLAVYFNNIILLYLFYIDSITLALLSLEC